jgi:hypothetical protein
LHCVNREIAVKTRIPTPELMGNLNIELPNLKKAGLQQLVFPLFWT